MKKLVLLAFVVLLSLTSMTSTHEDIVYVDSHNEDGTVKTLNQVLEQYKGKVVYIDFWASWCGPCRQQMPFAKRLHEQFEDKDVVFLYISFDSTESAWRNAVKKIQMKGVHFFPESNEAKRIGQEFDIYGIPRYIIVDKEGNIHDDNAPRPSSAKTSKKIEALL